MIELLVQERHIASIRSAILGQEREGCAVLYTRTVQRFDGTQRILATDIEIPDEDAYLARGLLEAQLNHSFVATVAKKARIRNLGLVFIHSHPGDSPPRFSLVDDAGERELAEFLARRIPDGHHCSVVFSNGGVSSRVLGVEHPVRVVSIGSKRLALNEVHPSDRHSSHQEHERQVRVFGAEGQRHLGALSVAIVGLGGTGSIVAQQLVHLGVRNFLLIDPDKVDATNLNRLANAAPTDVGEYKVDVATRYLKRVAPSASVEVLRDDVMRAKIARRLGDVDFIFGCTDSHGSRAVLQQVAYQFLVPCIDMGSTIVVHEKAITHVHGRVQMLAPGLPCLTCSGLLNSDEVRRDMMSPLERASDPYIVGIREPAPAVMSLNSTVASLSVTMLIAAVASLKSDARHVLYNALTSSLRVIAARAQPNCFICSDAGALAKGDDAPLMARQD